MCYPTFLPPLLHRLRAELQTERAEIAAESEHLRRAVEDQGQQVAALKEHAAQMEYEAQSAKDQVREDGWGVKLGRS